MKRKKILAVIAALAMMASAWTGVFAEAPIEEDASIPVNETEIDENVEKPKEKEDASVTEAEAQQPEGQAVLAADTVTWPYTAENGLVYNKYSNSEYVYVSNGKNATGEITIPQTITNPGDIERTVNGFDFSTFSGNKNITKVTFPNTITNSLDMYLFKGCTALEEVVMAGTFTSIGSNAFENCTALKSVTLPETVTKLNSAAFRGCTSLESIDLSKVQDFGDESLFNCTALKSVDLSSAKKLGTSSLTNAGITEVTLPEGMKSVGSNSFYGCASLATVNLPKDMTELPSGIFERCTALESITLPDSLTTIGSRAFAKSGLKSITLPAAVSTLESGIFSECASMTEIGVAEGNETYESVNGILYAKAAPNVLYMFPPALDMKNAQYKDSMTEFGRGSFSGYLGTEITIPAQVTKIGRQAFGSSKITTLTFEDADTAETPLDISDSAFEGLNKIKSISFPKRLKSIGKEAFLNFSDSALETITFAQDSILESIGDQAFVHAKIKSVEFPASLKSIGSSMFDNAANYSAAESVIESITFAEGSQLQEIPVDAFRNYVNLKSITIPASVTKIDDNAFRNCSKMTGVTFEENSQLQEIGSMAFYQTKLTEVEIPDSVETIESDAFYYMSSLQKITINDTSNLKSLGSGAFASSTAEELNLPDGLVTLGALGTMPNLKSIEIPDSVKKLSSSAFSGCKSLASVKLPKDLTEIPASAFSGTAITEITLPAGVSKIGDNAFNKCEKLKKVVALADEDTPVTFTQSGTKAAFNGTSGITFYTANTDIATFAQSNKDTASYALAPISDAGLTLTDTQNASLQLIEDKDNAGVYKIKLIPSFGGKINAFADIQFYLENTRPELDGLTPVIAEVEPADNMQLASKTDADGKTQYLLHVAPIAGLDGGVVEIPADGMIIGKIALSGYGSGELSITDAVGNKETADSTYDEITVDILENNVNVKTAYNLTPATNKLTVNVQFPNAVENQENGYQNMTITISGGELTADKVVKLGKTAELTNTSAAVSFADNAYQAVFEDELIENTAYTVTISGDGYRTVRYTVNMTEDKELTFWNNVMDNETIVEKGNDASKRRVTFLAGDIVKDNQINIYDLSAVVSYFGENGLTEKAPEEYAKYVKYDLNRDGKIDSKDVAMVLVSWNE